MGRSERRGRNIKGKFGMYMNGRSPSLQPTSARRFLQKNENRPKKQSEPFFFLICSKIETTVKKDTTRYSVLTQDIKRKVF